MQHEVAKATEGGLVAVKLPLFEGAEGKRVRAAQIVAMSLSSVLGAGTTRLALTGGLHVDVPKAWVLAKKPQMAQFYVQVDEETADVVNGVVFMGLYSPVDEPAEPEVPTAPLQQQMPETKSQDFSTLTENPEFQQWLNDAGNARKFYDDLVGLLVKKHPYGDSDAAAYDLATSSPSAADLDAMAAEQQAAAATAPSTETQPPTEEPAQESAPTEQQETPATEATSEPPQEEPQQN